MDNIEKVGIGEAVSFLDDVQDDLQKAMDDGKIDKQEAIQLFSVLLRHAIKFGITILAKKV